MKKFSFFILIFFLALSLLIAINKAKAADENIGKKKAFYFYQESCVHCQAVDEYFKENGIYEKYDIEKLEISGAYNLNYFNEFFDAFDIPSEKRGWPAIFFGQKFLVGDKPIQENFVNEIEKTNAANFPSPEVIKKSRTRISEGGSLQKTTSSGQHVSLLILLGAALADSVSPCILVIFVILASIIIFGNPENKKEIIIFGSFFLLSVFLTYLTLGIGMFGSGRIFKLAEILSSLLGLAVIAVGLFVLRKYWQNLKVMIKIKVLLKKFISHRLRGRPEEIWELTKKIIQKMNLAVAALMIGFVSSGFLFPCINKPYGIFTNSFSGEKEITANVLRIMLYDLVFILPIVFLSGIIYWFAHTKKLEVFRSRHDRLIRIIVGISLLFVGSYFIYNNC
jgi:cytochrome c biogenesis protein CcdA/glutaredoxin